MVIHVLLKLAYQSHRTCLSCIHVTCAGRQKKKRAPIKNQQQRSSSPVNPFWSHRAHNQNVWTRDMEDVKLPKASSEFRQPQGTGLSNRQTLRRASTNALLHEQSRQHHASQRHTRANKQHATDQTKTTACVNKTVPLLKTIVHSVPRCSHFYRQFPATCLLLRSNPPQHHSQTYNCSSMLHFTHRMGPSTGWTKKRDKPKLQK
jgi:hypothetical protein